MWAYRLTDGLADVTTHVSEEAAREYEQAGAVPAGGILTVYNGINVDRFAEKSGTDRLRCGQLRPGRRLVLSVGRLVPEKNQAALLRAFALIEAQHRDTDLWLVGEGPLRADLEALRAELGLDGRVCLVGKRDDVPALMRGADLLVLSSQVEGFGLVVAEAMASGTPVVATNVGGVSEVMQDHGILVPPGDVAALAQGMTQALALNPAQVARSSARNRNYVACHFDIHRLVNQWLDIYRGSRSCSRF
jgi:glycosyltransferase involved in cell wall biosynthesis